MGEAEEVRELEIGNASINIMSNGVGSYNLFIGLHYRSGRITDKQHVTG